MREREREKKNQPIICIYIIWFVKKYNVVILDDNRLS